MVKETHNVKSFRIYIVSAILLLCLAVSATAWAQRPPIEAVMRDVNERTISTYGEDICWPDSTIPGERPLFPGEQPWDDYYADDQIDGLIEEVYLRMFHEPLINISCYFGGLAYHYLDPGSDDEPTVLEGSPNRPPNLCRKYPWDLFVPLSPDEKLNRIMLALCDMQTACLIWS